MRNAWRTWLLVILAAAPLAATAGDDDDQEVSLFSLSLEQMLELKIESASKHPEQISEIPASVIIITRRDIETMGYTTLEEIIISVPGLFHIDNYEDLLIGVRGTLGGSIAFLVNGVLNHPVRLKGLTVPERSRLDIPVEAIDRIEIVRGPMSIIYGNNAFFGSINIITNERTEHEQGATGLVSAGLGNNGAGKGYFRLAGGNRSSFTVNGGWYRNDGIGGCFSDMMSDQQLAGLEPGMHTCLDGDLAQETRYFDLSWQRGGFSADLRHSLMEYGFYVFTPSFDEGNQLDLETSYAALGYASQLSDSLNIEADLVYSRETYDLDFDFLSPTLIGDQLQGSRRLEGELVLRYEGLGKLLLLAGLRHQRIFDIRNDVTIPDIGLFFVKQSDDVISNDLFLELNHHLSDRFEFIAGARWSRIEPYRFTDTRNPNQPDQSISTIHYDARSMVTPRIGIIYTIDEHHIIKGLYGEATQNNIEEAFTEPEEISTTELCYLATFPRWSLSASLFRNSITNVLRKIQRVNPDTGEYEKLVDNSGRWRTQGIEAVLKLRPSDHLLLQLSSTWQDTEDRNNPEIAVGSSPELLVKAEAAYHHRQMTCALNLVHVDAILADWQWRADTGGWERIGDQVDSYLLLGANLRYRRQGSGLSLNAHISNLLDEEIRYPANELVNFQHGAFGPGRRYMLTIGWELDLP
jgi:outer membrane receptor protein involved in Fe transport